MPPLNDFYSVDNWSMTENTLSCTLSFNAGHPIFDGHFPGNPIVPGVCTIQIINELLERALGQKLRLANSSNIKFLQLITPGVHPELHISWIKSEGLYTTNSLLKNGALPLFKMNAAYTDKI